MFLNDVHCQSTHAYSYEDSWDTLMPQFIFLSSDRGLHYLYATCLSSSVIANTVWTLKEIVEQIKWVN